MQVVAFSTPMNPHWRWRIVNYAGEVVEESNETFPTIASAVAQGTKRLALTTLAASWPRASDPDHRPRHPGHRGSDRTLARAGRGATRGCADHPALAPEPSVSPRGAGGDPPHRRHRLRPHVTARRPPEDARGLGQPRLAKRGLPRVRGLYGDAGVRSGPGGADRARAAATDGDHVRGDGILALSPIADRRRAHCARHRGRAHPGCRTGRAARAHGLRGREGDARHIPGVSARLA